jgi:6-pyruvoyltetrahydropterin/6-carboxytetrahydropterin synthase
MRRTLASWGRQLHPQCFVDNTSIDFTKLVVAIVSACSATLMQPSRQQTYRVGLDKEYHVFSAAHFITFNGNICERLHGHNYRVKVDVPGSLDENGYVVDFIALRDRLHDVLGELDHRMLLPDRHPTIHVATDEREVTVTFEDRRWVFPKGDCVILPVANTTAELLARWIGETLAQRLMARHNLAVKRLTVAVDENHGQWGICELVF